MRRHGSWGFSETLSTMRSKKYKGKTGQRARAVMPFPKHRQKERLRTRNLRASLSLLKGL